MKDYSAIISKQKRFFSLGKTKDINYRLDALQKLKAEIIDSKHKIYDGLKEDLNKSYFEAYSTEIGFVLSEISFTMKHLRAWEKPKKVKTPLTHFGSRSYIYSEPYGVVLIIAPWNYPFHLSIAPLVGAIAAGNCAIIKPSEFSPKTSKVLEQIISKIFPEKYIAVVQGGVETSQAILSEKFDKIFFTGSVSVGKIVMEAAAKHLTPVTLELGGKSPCIVHEDAHVKLAAKRIAWGKFINAGQTCVAPDYVYVHNKIQDKFLRELKVAIKELYGDSPLKNPNYTHIINLDNFQRLKNYLGNGITVIGGRSDNEKLAIEPTVLSDIRWDDSVMKDEIFGPILPVIEYSKVSDIVRKINHHPKPLALYLFTENLSLKKKIIKEISFGGGCINDTIYHLASPYLPFGGVGSSGMGSYHGEESFNAFSHKKSILKQTTKFDIPFRYQNVKNGLKNIKRFLK